MKVIILCGGKGTRLREETDVRPKPLVQIGNRPILWHIMKIYAHYGYKDFILSLGYKGNMIKEYFLNYEVMNNNCTIQLGIHNKIQFHGNHEEENWNVTLVDTGGDAQTGARIKRVEEHIDGDSFMVTYGDGVGNIDIKKLVKFHESYGKIGTVTGVHPSSRFGDLIIKDNVVKKFHEKAQVGEGLINGGFFVFNKAFLKYLKEEDDCILEKGPLEKLTSEGQLTSYVHDDFWQCVDTYRELELLNSLWRSSRIPWKVW
ncbi:MAG: glucose-1-phosphate cytidylyltransferase [Candidatus Aureabacteria bacterium]|nr:glucose-1-phosphate cytidylyltransferase [Candidatus Auribacterota bacterium]